MKENVFQFDDENDDCQQDEYKFTIKVAVLGCLCQTKVYKRVEEIENRR